MLHILLVWILSAIALLITSKLVKGFELKDFKSAMVAAVVIGLLNALVKPILFVLTFPITLLTLGLFTFVLTAIVLKLAAGMMKSFKIADWTTAIIAAVVLAIVQVLLNLAF